MSNKLNKFNHPFFREIECEHGWMDDKGFPRCDLGSGLGYDLISFCHKDYCPIYEEDEEDEEDEENAEKLQEKS